MLSLDARTLAGRLERHIQADPDVVSYAVWVTVWGRWVGLALIASQLAYRPGFWYPDHVELVLLSPPFALLNALVHHRLRTNRPVTRRWMLALSAMDIIAISLNSAGFGGFDTYGFLGYYPALAAFALVFSSLRLILVWTTGTAVVYALISLLTGGGLDLDAAEDKILTVRLAVMYLIAVVVSLIVRFERARRETAIARERRMLEERIELSQSIHDTTAQTAYLINAGIEAALRLADGSNPKLTERLTATAELTRSAMWELRRPIDAGRIYEGRELSRVLGAHTATFAKITAVHAEMRLSGREPPLSTELRSSLFTIAHNALANACLHAQAKRVEVKLDFDPDRIRLSISDDGIGLPDDYAERGRGFRGMQRDAERVGGRLRVESGRENAGTSIHCEVPLDASARRD